MENQDIKSTFLQKYQLKEVNGEIIRDHTEEELKQVKIKSSVSSLLIDGVAETNKEDFTSLNYDEIIQAQSTGQKAVINAFSSDKIEIGIGGPKVNVVLQRISNENYPKITVEDKKDAAHASINLQYSSDSGEFSVTDKDLIKETTPLFTHRASFVENGAIIQRRPAGQMESTAVILNEGYEPFDTLNERFTSLGNILSVLSAEHVIKTVIEKKGNAIKAIINQIYILNKGSIRNMIDNRYLTTLPLEEARNSTKADRYEYVTNIMSVVNDILGTYATDAYVATCELQNWSYSILNKDSNYNLANKKGRKFFSTDGGKTIFKVDMRGSRAGGRYPINKEHLDWFKRESAKLQELYLIIMENQIREGLGFDKIPQKAVIFEKEEMLKNYSEKKIIEYMVEKLSPEIDNKQLSADDLISMATNNIKNAVDKAFNDRNESMVVNNL